MVRSFLYCVGILVYLEVANGYSTGPPPGACAGMAPNPASSGGHGADPQNVSSSPYDVTTNVPSGGAMTANNYTGTDRRVRVATHEVIRQL